MLYFRSFTFKLRPDKTPKQIDVTFKEGEKKGDTFEGIYVLRPNELRICLRLTHPEHGRPAGFRLAAVTTGGSAAGDVVK